METLKSLILVGLAMLGLTFTADAQLAQTPFEGSFLVGNNMAFTCNATTTTTNYYAGTNTWIKGGVSITNGTSYTPATGSYVITNTQSFTDVGLWYDRDGSQPSAGFGFMATGQDARATNFVTVRFASVSRGLASTSVLNQWASSFTLNGATPVNVITNFPAGPFVGTHKVRITQIESTGGTNFTLNFADLKGFKP